MDINSLLSPSDTPTQETPPPLDSPSLVQNSPLKRPGRPTKRNSSYLSQTTTLSVASPRSQQDSLPTPTLSHHNAAFSLPHLPSPGIAPSPAAVAAQAAVAGANGRAVGSAASTPSIESAQSQQQPMHRQASTPGMDTLADLASMQHHQQASRQNPQQQQQQQQTSRPPHLTLENLPRTISATSAKEILMAEPSPRPPRVFADEALSEAESKSLSELAETLADKPNDYDAHVRFISILRKGFVEASQPQNPNLAPREPHLYRLLPELRAARRDMNDRYGLGEDLLREWIDDEKRLARNTEERLSLLELCNRAVTEEPSSTILWRTYGNIVYDFWASAQGLEGAPVWSEEDRIVGREAFQWSLVMSTWEQGAGATQWRIDESHHVWDRFMELLLEDQRMWPSPQKVQNITTIFGARLLRPHATWDNTLQMYSSFIAAHDRQAYENYEQIMAEKTKQAKSAKSQIAYREPFEHKLQVALSSKDRAAEWEAFAAYLDWERRMKGVFSIDLIGALFERATLRFPTAATLWEDYIEFLVEESGRSNATGSPLSVIERASRHCPWSGDIWTHHVLALEAENRPFADVEAVKHKATKTGLLDVGGMEELLKVYIAWCSYLRRRAFGPHSSEDDVDIAEVGIRSALEHVREIGEKKYGREYKGDPLYRLERIHIKFFTQGGNTTAARQCWQVLTKTYGDSFDFWYRYYIFEMVLWSRFCMRDASNTGRELPTPQEATAVLKQGLERIATMDWPEQLITMYLNHCEHHEAVQTLRLAVIESRRMTAQVAKRREQEAAVAAEQQQQQQDQLQQQLTAQHQAAEDAAEEDEETPAGSSSGKRKRREEDLDDALKSPTKKTRSVLPGSVGWRGSVDVAMETVEEEENASSGQPKRDREKATILVQNLPSDATQTRVRQFFRDAGTVVSINLFHDGETQSAVVEFELADEAQYAQHLQVKPFDGSHITIQSGKGTTLFVTNYPDDADETFMRRLFDKFGEILSVRFPSLKYNTHRRFCYIQFSSESAAIQASNELDGKELQEASSSDQKAPLRLVAKLSDPSKRQDRSGAQYDGREVYVHNLPFSTSESAVRDLFKAHGAIQRVRVPTKVGGRGKGYAFVVFATKSEAAAAASAVEGTEYKGRLIHAEISDTSKQSTKRHATLVLASASPEPSSLGERRRSTQSASAVPGDANSPTTANGVRPGTIRARTIALLDLPDTVNDARVRSLCSPHGSLVKIVLIPRHRGATVEFASVSDAGKAALALDGVEVAPGRKVRVGDVSDLNSEVEEFRSDRIAGAPGKKDKKGNHGQGAPRAAQPFAGSGHIARPAQAGAARRGGKGGLGIKRGGGAALPPGRETASAGEGVKPKSNADFAALVKGGDDK